MGEFTRTAVYKGVCNNISFSNDFEKVTIDIPYQNKYGILTNTIELCLESDGNYYQLESLLSPGFSLIGFNLYIFNPDDNSLLIYSEETTNEDFVNSLKFKCHEASFSGFRGKFTK